jgi:hypothetical protein
LGAEVKDQDVGAGGKGERQSDSERGGVFHK